MVKIKKYLVSKCGTKGGYTYIKLWTKIPDSYSFLSNLGQGDKDFLTYCWDFDNEGGLSRLISRFPCPSLCRGCITLMFNFNKATNKKISLTLLKKSFYGVKIELNYPEQSDKGFPLREPELLIDRLGLPWMRRRLLINDLNSYISLWFLRYKAT